MALQALDETVISQIRSNLTINSLTQCITELVMNSLDAKSAAIAVRVNLSTFQIQVIDNGCGISRTNLEQIGIRYMTNKCHSLSDLRSRLKCYGFRGEALASIIDTSKRVVITSREQNSEETYCKRVENGVGLVEVAKLRPSCGTTVIIEGFLHNLPVRQQCIKKNELETVRKHLEGFVIINPRVSFTLRNDETGKLLLDSGKCDDVISAFKSVNKDISVDNFVFLKITKHKTSVDGLISRIPHHNKQLQYVYVNKRPVNSAKIQNYVNSFFGKFRKGTENFKAKQCGVYIIHIKCPYCDIDINLEPNKTNVLFKRFDVIKKCLTKIMQNALDIPKPILEPKKIYKAKSQFGLSIIDGAVKGKALKQTPIGDDSQTDKEILGKKRKSEDFGIEQESKKMKDSLLDNSFYTENPDSEGRGKEMIMEMFVKSLQNYPEQSQIEKIEKESTIISSKPKSMVSVGVQTISNSLKKHISDLDIIEKTSVIFPSCSFDDSKCNFDFVSLEEKKNPFETSRNQEDCLNFTFFDRGEVKNDILSGLDLSPIQKEQKSERTTLKKSENNLEFTLFDHKDVKYQDLSSLDNTLLSPIPKERQIEVPNMQKIKNNKKNFTNFDGGNVKNDVSIGLDNTLLSPILKQQKIEISKMKKSEKILDVSSVSRFFTPKPIPKKNQSKKSIFTEISVKNSKSSMKLNETVSRFFQPFDTQTNISFNKSNESFHSLEKTEIENKTSEILPQNESTNDWIKEINSFGAVIYVNTKTGVRSFYSPQKEHTFSISKRFEFLPKGQSPIIREPVQVDSLNQNAKNHFQNEILRAYDDDLLLVKWQNYVNNKDPKQFFDDLYMEKSRLIEDSVPNVAKSGKAKCFAKIFTGMCFTNDLFDNIDVIGQVDCKFIAAFDKNKSLLLLFDQHAVNERVRTEELGETAHSPINIQQIPIFLRQNDLTLFRNCKNSLQELIGLEFECFRNGINVTKIPLCVYTKSTKGFNLGQLVEALIAEIVETLKVNDGILVKTPNLVQNLINSEACRGAIKFGDRLTVNECNYHLKMLGKCKLPFQCAHGRPTLTPLITLNANFELKDAKTKPNLLKIKNWV